MILTCHRGQSRAKNLQKELSEWCIVHMAMLITFDKITFHNLRLPYIPYQKQRKYMEEHAL